MLDNLITSGSLTLPISLTHLTIGYTLKGSMEVGISMGWRTPGAGSTKGGSVRCSMMISFFSLV